MNKKYQVFISSTYEDLIEERKEVVQAVLACSCIPVGMELFPASSKSKWEVIKKVIDDCDYYLVIIAGKYGSQGTDENGKLVSYTEMEFDYALKTDKPIIAFIHKEPDKIPSIFTERTKEATKKLNSFRNKAMNGRVVDFWDNKDNLNTAVVKSLTNICINSPGIGWIRCNDIKCNDIKCNEIESNIENNNKIETVIVKPKKVDDAKEIAEHIMQNKVVHIFFEYDKISVEVAQRITDFITGAAFAVYGSVIQVSNYSFIAVSKKISIKDL